jgi:hypothetical protein
VLHQKDCRKRALGRRLELYFYQIYIISVFILGDGVGSSLIRQCQWLILWNILVFIADDEKYAGKFKVEAPLKDLPDPALKVGDP